MLTLATPEASLAVASNVMGPLTTLPGAGLVIATCGAWVSTSTPPDSAAVVTVPVALRNCTLTGLRPSPSETVKATDARPLFSGWNEVPAKAVPSAMRNSVALMQATSSVTVRVSKKACGLARRTDGAIQRCQGQEVA